MPDLYGEHHMKNPRFSALVGKARQTNAERDRIEEADGWASPSETNPSEELRTALEAIACGIAVNDWNAVAEGWLMVQHAESRIRELFPVPPEHGGGIMLRGGGVWHPKFL